MTTIVAAVIIIGYLGFGTIAVCILFALYLVFRSLAPGDVRITIPLILQRRGTRIAFVRNRIAVVLFVMSLPVCWTGWIALMVKVFRQSGAFEGSTKSLLKSRSGSRNLTLAQIALPLTVYALGLLALRIVAGPTWAIMLGLYAGQTCLLANLLAQAIGTWDLATTLRRGYLPPFVALVVVAVEYSIATITLATVGMEWQGRLPTIDVVVEAARMVALFHSPSEVYHSFTMSIYVALMALTSLTFYYLVIHQLVQYKKFMRTAEDYAFITISLVDSGHLREAEKRLASVPSKLRSGADLANARICVALLAREWANAVEYAGLFNSLHAHDEYPKVKTDTIDDRLVMLMATCLSIAATSRAHDVELLKATTDYGISDGALAQCLYLVEDQYGRALEVSEVPVADDACYPITNYYKQLMQQLNSESIQIESGDLRTLLNYSAIAPDRFAIACLLLAQYKFNHEADPARVAILELVQLCQVQDLPTWVYNALTLQLQVAAMISRDIGAYDLGAAVAGAQYAVLEVLGPEVKWRQVAVNRALSRNADSILGRG